MQVAIIDYGMGNLFSVQKKLKRLGAEGIITHDASTIAAADKIILPGVGHFGMAMDNLANRGLVSVLNEEVLEKKKPVLGICLGMQLMASKSEEGKATGLGWFDADVVAFDMEDKLRHKVPHMGWNDVQWTKPSVLQEGLSSTTSFYFVHAFYVKSNSPEDVLNESNYEHGFHSGLQKDNIFGVQYHPEKSHMQGELLFKNFLSI